MPGQKLTICLDLSAEKLYGSVYDGERYDTSAMLSTLVNRLLQVLCVPLHELEQIGGLSLCQKPERGIGSEDRCN